MEVMAPTPRRSSSTSCAPMSRNYSPAAGNDGNDCNVGNGCATISRNYSPAEGNDGNGCNVGNGCATMSRNYSPAAGNDGNGCNVGNGCATMSRNYYYLAARYFLSFHAREAARRRWRRTLEFRSSGGCAASSPDESHHRLMSLIIA